ncbi:MAG: pitrilysin family protein [Nannocystaceae bacterium]
MNGHRSHRARGRTLLTLLSAGLMVASLACKPSEPAAPPVDPAAEAAAKAKADKEAAAKDRADKAAAKRAELAALPPLPGVEAPKAVDFPKPIVSTLDNGLEVIVLEDHEMPVVDISLVVKAGNIYAPAEHSKLAALTANLLEEGTKKLKKKELDEKIDATGGSKYASAGDELVYIGADVLARDADLGMKLLAAEATEPAFPEDSFEKIKRLMIQEVASEKSSPFGLALRMGEHVIFGEKSPYGRAFPTDDEITALTRDQVVAFYEKHYHPGNAMLVIAGDITADKAASLAKKHFGKWKAGEPIVAPSGDKQGAPTKTVVHLVDREASAQATIAIVVPAPKIGEAGYLDGKILQALLGGGLSGRLNQVLREQLGLTYGVGAFNSYGYEGGMFFAGGNTKTKSATEFTEALLELLKEPADKGIAGDELGRIQSKLSGQFALEVEGVGVMARKTITQRTYGLAPDFWERYRVDIEAATPEQIKTSSQALWGGPVQIIAVGNASKLKEPLSAFGEVHVYDLSLKPKG